MTIVRNKLNDVIRLLQDISNDYGDIPISINLYNDKVLALQSICLDNNDIGLGVQVLFEADRDNSLEQTEQFEFYTLGTDLSIKS